MANYISHLVLQNNDQKIAEAFNNERLYSLSTLDRRILGVNGNAVDWLARQGTSKGNQVNDRLFIMSTNLNEAYNEIVCKNIRNKKVFLFFNFGPYGTVRVDLGWNGQTWEVLNR